MFTNNGYCQLLMFCCHCLHCVSPFHKNLRSQLLLLSPYLPALATRRPNHTVSHNFAGIRPSVHRNWFLTENCFGWQQKLCKQNKLIECFKTQVADKIFNPPQTLLRCLFSAILHSSPYNIACKSLTNLLWIFILFIIYEPLAGHRAVSCYNLIMIFFHILCRPNFTILVIYRMQDDTTNIFLRAFIWR